MVLNIGFKNPAQKKENKILEGLEEVSKLKNKRDMKSEEKTVIVDFSWKVWLFLLLALVFIFRGNAIITIFIFVFVAFILMSAAKPIVTWLMRRKFPKGLAIAVTYISGFILFSGVISAVVVPLTSQLGSFIEVFPDLVGDFVANFNGLTIGSFTVEASTITNMVSEFFKNFSVTDSFASVAGTLGSVFSLSTLLLAAVVFSIYMILDHDSILDFGLVRISSDSKRERVKKLVLDTESKLGNWLLGQTTVSIIAGLVMGLVMAVLGIPFALPLAVFIALMDAIPNIGATIATIPVVLVALLTGGPLSALLILVIFIAYQQIENNVIIPRVMGSAIGVKPIAILLVAMSFLILFGMWGAVLAIPALVIGMILYEFYIDLQKIEAKGSI